MESVVGIFASREGAEKSVHELLARGVPRHSVIFLTSAVKEKEVESVPTTDAEADGMGETMGVVVGGAAGMSAGLALGTAVASLAVPGVGVIMAAGLGAAAALGIAGGITGAEIGKHTEHSLDTGVPRDDIAFYHQLLKAGRSLVIVNTEARAKEAREVLDENGAEDVDDARKEWRNAA